MHYHIHHTTHYHYSRAVQLSKHIVRLRPRSDGSQQLQGFAIAIEPNPVKTSDVLDVEGNACLCLWFDEQPTTSLVVRTESEVQTTRANPFDYLSEPWAIAAPIDYPDSVHRLIAPYLQPTLSTAWNPQVVTFAQTILHQVNHNVGFFLSQLTQEIYEEFQYLYRQEGQPQSAGITLAQKSGSCRDFAVLFVEACQAVGLAARFVSGYQEGDPDQSYRELHAWPEVYIPGGGWRGFDPTHGLAVSDRHIALAASAYPIHAAPISGQLQPGYFAETTLDYEIRLARLSTASHQSQNAH